MGFADRSTTGPAGADSYKAEFTFRANRNATLRGSYQHAVRAPSIEELYYPEIASQFVVPIPDPCSVNSRQRNGPDRQQVEALCLAQGLPPALLPTYTFVLRRVDGVSGGNPDLEPEQGDTYTVGIVLDSAARAALAQRPQADGRLVPHRFRKRHRPLGHGVGGHALLRSRLQPQLRSSQHVLHVLHPRRADG